MKTYTSDSIASLAREVTAHHSSVSALFEQLTGCRSVADYCFAWSDLLTKVTKAPILVSYDSGIWTATKG